MKALLKAPTLLKHRVFIGVLYGCGLQCQELRSLLVKDIDFDRNMIHVRQGKGRKDRYVPIGEHLSRGLKKYLEVEKPVKWLFNGKNHHEPFSQRGAQWVVRQATKKTGIKKHVSVHTLRHTYATRGDRTYRCIHISIALCQGVVLLKLDSGNTPEVMASFYFRSRP